MNADDAVYEGLAFDVALARLADALGPPSATNGTPRALWLDRRADCGVTLEGAMHPALRGYRWTLAAWWGSAPNARVASVFALSARPGVPQCFTPETAAARVLDELAWRPHGPRVAPSSPSPLAHEVPDVDR